MHHMQCMCACKNRLQTVAVPKPHRIRQTNGPTPPPNLARHRRSRQTFGFAGFKLQEGTQSMQHAYKTDYRTVDHMQKNTDLNKING